MSVYASEFELIGKHRIIFDKEEQEVVTTAIDIFTSDLIKVADKDIPESGTEIIIGTIGNSPSIDRLISKRKISVKEIANKWEAFKINT